ncbi:MAG: hypothetical protein ACRCZ2_06145 [Fusobacteriaceae bacterium]
MYNQKDKKMNFTIKLTLDEAKKMLTYFNEEFMDSYDDFLLTLEEGGQAEGEEYEYYEDLREVLSDLVYEFKKEIRKKERTDSKNRDMDELEKDGIKEKLNQYSQEILKKIHEFDKNIYVPSLYKIYWYLHNSFDKSGELIFSQNSLEDLLDMDKNSLEKFLKEMSSIEINIGNRKGRIIEKFRFLNSSTVKIDYNLHVVNPYSAAYKDKEFKIDTLDKIFITKHKKEE